MEMSIKSFLEEVQQEVQLYAEEIDSNLSLSSAFTTWASEVLIDAGHVDEVIPVVYESKGMALSAYSYDDVNRYLDLIIVDYQPSLEPRSVTRIEVESGLKKVASFATKAQAGKLNIDPAHSVNDLADLIEMEWEKISEVRIRYLTNGLAKEVKTTIEFPNKRTRTDVWDLERFFKLAGSGKTQESIEVDITKYGQKVQCIGPFGSGVDYEAYFAVFPGDVLASIYDDFGPRLLELNVRSFLQARGKVNKGLQETIKIEPEHFLAFNNGIVITSSEIVIDHSGNGAPIVRSIKDFQIVNGGQTTASLYHARQKNGLDLGHIEVQAKITVVRPEQLTQLVPKISQFANSQNTIKTTDFSANDPFHVEIERLSRSIWAPSPDGGHVLTKWFYERARGQYADALGRERTPSKQKEFKKNHPPNQKFTKTDLSKYELVWDQQPHLVALGAEKAFREYALLLGEKGNALPSNKYFERLIAKAIIYRQGEKIISSMQLGGYRSQTLIYTLALISYKTKQEIDLYRIWSTQRVYSELEESIRELAPIVRSSLISSAGSRNISEWAKKKDFWKEIQNLSWSPHALLSNVNATKGFESEKSTREGNNELDDEEFKNALAAIQAISPEIWKGLASWAKETSNLQPWQRGLSFSIGNLLLSGKPMTRKQAIQGMKIIDEAKTLGYLS